MARASEGPAGGEAQSGLEGRIAGGLRDAAEDVVAGGGDGAAGVERLGRNGREQQQRGKQTEAVFHWIGPGWEQAGSVGSRRVKPPSGPRAWA